MFVNFGLDAVPLGENLPILLASLFAYLVYGVVLGSVYDLLASHRTFLSSAST